MTNGINRRKPNQTSPADFISDVQIEKNPIQIDNQTKSGFYSLNETTKRLTSSEIPNVVEGVVLLIANDNKKIRYKNYSNNASYDDGGAGFLEDYCVYVRTGLDIGNKSDPFTFLEDPSDGEDPEGSIESYLQMVFAHDLLAPLYPGTGVPTVGDHVRVTYDNVLVDSGQPIKGYYEVLSTDKSYFQKPTATITAALKTINSFVESVLALTNDDVVPLVEYPVCNPSITSCAPEQVFVTIRPMAQGDPEWSRKKLGSKNIGQIGCLLTVYTMAHNYLLNPTYELTPDVALDVAKPRGGFQGGIIVHNPLAESLGLKFDGFSKNNSKSGLIGYIENGIAEGNAVSLHVDYRTGPAAARKPGHDGIGDHWILCIKKDSAGNYICNDPATGTQITVDKENLRSNLSGGRQYRVVKALKISRG